MQNPNILFYRCGTNCRNGCKEDCYWYGEWQDMGAHIPYCKCKSGDFIEPKDCNNCEQYHSKYKPTNADKLRTMSDEELAEWVWSAESAGRAYGPRGKNAWLGWLRQEATE